jgi:hypothetical protein
MPSKETVNSMASKWQSWASTLTGDEQEALAEWWASNSGDDVKGYSAGWWNAPDAWANAWNDSWSGWSGWSE